MLLAVDIGNTQTVFGVFEEGECVHTWRIDSNIHRTADELEALLATFFTRADLAPAVIETVIIGSVVPSLTQSWVQCAASLFGLDALVVGPGLATGLKLVIDNPHEAGADRIANAIAAKAVYGYPVAVIDFGTATNIDIVDADGNYAGGVISPGLETSAAALFTSAARLAELDLVAPPHVLGKNTKHAVQSGLVFGEVAKVEGLLERVIAELNVASVIPVVATGGLARKLAPFSTKIDHINTNLTLEGLARVAARHSHTAEQKKE